MFAGEPQAGRRAERQAADMGAFDADGLHERRDVVGEQSRGIGAGGLVGLPAPRGSTDMQVKCLAYSAT